MCYTVAALRQGMAIIYLVLVVNASRQFYWRMYTTTRTTVDRNVLQRRQSPPPLSAQRISSGLAVLRKPFEEAVSLSEP